jgi:hypothetical protein
VVSRCINVDVGAGAAVAEVGARGGVGVGRVKMRVVGMNAVNVVPTCPAEELMVRTFGSVVTTCVTEAELVADEFEAWE